MVRDPLKRCCCRSRACAPMISHHVRNQASPSCPSPPPRHLCGDLFYPLALRGHFCFKSGSVVTGRLGNSCCGCQEPQAIVGTCEAGALWGGRERAATSTSSPRPVGAMRCASCPDRLCRAPGREQELGSLGRNIRDEGPWTSCPPSPLDR